MAEAPDVSHVGSTEDSLFGTRLDASGERIPGKASLADGGTLYLEGIDRLSKSAQSSLLQFLKDAAAARSAGNRPVPDVRLVVYSVSSLSEEVRQGRFDPDLERAMGPRRLVIPSFAERRDDIVLIAERVMLLCARSMGKVLDGLTAEAKDRLLRYSWPGNVQELQSVLERAVVLSHDTRLEIPDELLSEGPKLGSYTLVRQLGSGAMGDVWLARHALLARPAAVKLIRKQALEVDPKLQDVLRTRFQREARATARLRSPHTVELYDFGVAEDGSFYYAMEYLTGVDLQALVERYGAQDPARVVFLLMQACLSLAEAHEAGLVHRDIKPSNLFTCRLGKSSDFLKVLDFGVVRLTESQDHLVTATGQLAGTPATMAPEIIEGAQADAGADIYGVGCVAYWLLAGKPVFDAPNLMALLLQHRSKIPDAPSTHNSAVPKELDEIVLSCLAKDLQNRPINVEQLREQLAGVPIAEPWNERRASVWWNEHASETNAIVTNNASEGFDEAETVI